ncbi:MAG: acyltransferase family protein [Streptosporangiales bacterium]|nr:acyltransferase family protein [Streptosporangiales bacterium]
MTASTGTGTGTTGTTGTATTGTGTTATPPPTTGARPRDPHLDNARFLAVVLVVAGHAWAPLAGMGAVDAMHLAVYTFHLPVFVLISGYLEANSSGRDRARRLFTGVLVPYLIFEAAYPAWAALVAGRHFSWSPFEPYYVTWFLLALLCWRLSAPVWRLVRWPVPIAVAVALAAGAVALPEILQRALVLMPFFVLGMRLRAEHLTVLRRPAVRVAAAALLLLAPVAALFLESRVDAEWVHWRADFAGLGQGVPLGVAVRAAALAAATLLTAAFLALVPSRHVWFTRYGSATLQVYLLHGFVVLAATWAGWYTYARSIPGAVIVTVAAVGLALLLARPIVARVTRWAVAPRLTWLLR